MTKEEMREHCYAYGYSDGEVSAFYDGVEKGRIDAIDKVIDFLKAQFVMQNNPNSKFVPSIVLHEDFVKTLEDFKSHK